MALRLSSASGSKPFCERLVEDGRLSLGQKTDALKTARVLISNTVDPAKSQDPKFRRLKLGNAKLQQKIFSIPVMMELLQFVGFEHQSVEGEDCLVMKDGFTQPCQACLVDLQVAQDRLAASSTNNNNMNAPVLEKLTEKQKARVLLEGKERQEKLAIKENRKRNLAMLKEDKRARHSDPNWKSGVSAACAKSGSGISTFRDKYGE
jgi:hypothetical protein